MKKLERGEVSWFAYVASIFSDHSKEIKFGFDPKLVSAGKFLLNGKSLIRFYKNSWKPD